MFTLKTFNGKSDYSHVFYILNKGNNAGKPSYLPFRNSFIVICNDHATLTTLFWACKALYINNKFRVHILGSVIPTIRLSSVRNALYEAYNKAITEQTALLTIVNQVNQLEALLSNYSKHSELIRQTQELILYNYFIKK